MTQASLLIPTAAEVHRHVVKGRRGEDLKQAGQAATLEAEKTEWLKRTLFLFKSYLTSFSVGDRFAFEDFRAYAMACEHIEPHSDKTWGAMPAYFIKHGCAIRRTDRTRKASSPKTRGHYVTLWEVIDPTSKDE